MKLKLYNSNFKKKKINVYILYKIKKKKFKIKTLVGEVIKIKRKNHNTYFKLLIKVKNNIIYYNISSASPYFLFYEIRKSS